MSEREYSLPFTANVIQTQRATVGRTRENDDRFPIWGDCPHLCQMRVGWISPELVAEGWTAMLSVANGMQYIGPIDLPFTANVEQPVEIAVTPSAAPAADQRVMISLCDLPNPPNLYGASYLPTVDKSGVALIPPWVVAVTVYADPTTTPTGTFLDPSSTAIGTFAANVMLARPRLAKSIQVTSGAAVIFHY